MKRTIINVYQFRGFSQKECVSVNSRLANHNTIDHVNTLYNAVEVVIFRRGGREMPDI